MSRSQLTGSHGQEEKYYSFSGDNTVNFFESDANNISRYGTHSYHFLIDNKQSSTVKVEVQVTNSINSDFVTIFEALVGGSSKESFNFKEIFNFKFSRIKISSGANLRGSFFFSEAHTPWYRPSFDYFTGTPTPPPTITLTETKTETPRTETE